MLELIGFSVLLVVGCGLLCLLVVLPFILVGAVFKLLFFLVMLPLRLIGALFGLFATAVTGLFTAVLAVVGALGGLALLVGGLLAVPFIPLLLFGLGIWFLVRLSRPRASVRAPA